MGDVAVIIPMYNASRTIDRTMASLAAQSLTSWKAVVIDDGSIDSSAEQVAAVAAADPRVTLVKQACAGVSAARNRGLDEAARLKTEWILYLDADDTMAPGGIEALINTAHNAGTRAAMGDFRFVDERGDVLGRQNARFSRVGHNEHLGSVFMLPCSQIVEARYAQRVRFDPSLAFIEDTDVWLRLAELGVTWAVTREIVSDYTIRPTSRSFKCESMMQCTRRVYTSAFQRARGVIGVSGGGDLDLSPTRLEGVLMRAALNYATRAALASTEDSANLDLAQSLLSLEIGGHRLDADLLARTAHRAVIMSLAIKPENTAQQSTWLPRLEAWWSRCAALGWITTTIIDEARTLLAKAIGLKEPACTR